MISDSLSDAVQEKTMLSHSQIWTAIDMLAQRYGLTTSGLAKKAGLDPTTFNKSKRVSTDGRLRWPSTESIAKILDATGATLDEFLSILTRRGAGGPGRLLPLVSLEDASADGLFDAQGNPIGNRWDEVSLPGNDDENSFGLEVSGDGLLPHYSHGDILICSPKEAIRRSDRVIVRMTEGQVFVAELRRRTAKTIDLALFNPDKAALTVRTSDMAWIARIIWASQ
jgi:phage repressor protein C with HTH and peptisase S24 domain